MNTINIIFLLTIILPVFLFLAFFFLPYVWMPGVGFSRLRYDMLAIPLVGLAFLVQCFRKKITWQSMTLPLKVMFTCNVLLFLWMLVRVNTDLFAGKIPHPIRGHVNPVTIFGNYGCMALAGMLFYLVFEKWLSRNKTSFLISFLVIAIVANVIGGFTGFFPEHPISEKIYDLYGGAKRDIYGVSRYAIWNASDSTGEFMVKHSKRVCSIFTVCSTYACFCVIAVGISVLCFDGRFAHAQARLGLRILASITLATSILGGVLSASKTFSLGIYVILFIIFLFTVSHRMRLGVAVLTIILFASWPFLAKLDMIGGHRNNLIVSKVINKAWDRLKPAKKSPKDECQILLSTPPGASP